jgi:hypothetical protein
METLRPGRANGLIGGPPCRVSLLVPVACYWGGGDLVGGMIVHLRAWDMQAPEGNYRTRTVGPTNV